MKQILLIGIIVLVLASSASASHVTEKQLECYAATACETGDITLMQLSSTTNAHASLPGGSYPQKMCCGSDSTTITNACDANSDIVATLSAQTNAHLGEKSSSYSEKVCLSSPGKVHCTIAPTPPDSSYECIIGISSTTNAHAARCDDNPYNNKVYCSIGAQSGSLPKYWREAYGSLYEDYGRGHTERREIFAGKKNVIVITDEDSSPYGIVSEYHVVQLNTILTASVDTHCTDGKGVLELEWWNKDYQRLSSIKTTTTETDKWQRIFVSGAVPANAQYATVLLHSNDGLIDNEAVCGFDDVQLQVSSLALTDYKFIPYSGYVEDVVDPSPYLSPVKGGYACCAEKQCWDGEQCQPDQINDADPQPKNDHLCFDGNWIFSPERTDLDGETGYCPSDTQCLLSVDGKNEFNNQISRFYQFPNTQKQNLPKCVDSKTIAADNICNAGVWETRTRTVALELLKLVEARGDKEKFTLYCDNYERALVELTQNELDAITGLKGDITDKKCFDDRNLPCINNFCVLDYNEGSTNKHVVGMSLNILPTDQPSILAAIGGACSTSGNSFSQCGSTNTWYNPELNTLIHSKEGISLAAGTESFFQSIRNLISDVKDFFTGENDEETSELIDNIKRFDRVYLSAAGQKRIISVQETVNDRSFILAQYEGFTNICSSLQRASDSRLGAITCETQNSVTTVFSQDEEIMGRWQEFTSKLRVS